MQLNTEYLNSHRNTEIEVEVVPIEEVEMDKMWSFTINPSNIGFGGL